MTRICLVLVFHCSILAMSSMVSETTKAPPVAPENVKRRLVAREGTKSFTLTCPAEGSPPLLVSWNKDGEPVTPAWTRFKPVNRERDLRIRNVALEDAGLYKCHATNGFGMVEMEFTLQIIGKDEPPYEYSDGDHEDDENYRPKELKGFAGRPPFWVKSDQIKEQTKAPLLYTKGSIVRLKCLATGLPVPDILWTKDDEPLDNDQMANKWIFHIRHMKASDVGKYSCRVYNMFGSLNATFSVGILDDKPEFEKTLLNATIPEGQTATFQCKVRSSVTPTIKWIKRIDLPNFIEDNKTFAFEGRLFRVLEVNPPEPVAYPNSSYMKQLVISNVKPQDAGWYFCVVADTVGNIVNRSANLKVLSAIHPMMTVDENVPMHVVVGICIAVLLVLVVGYAIYFLRKHQQKPVNGPSNGHALSLGCPRHSIGRSGGGILPQPPSYPPPLAPNNGAGTKTVTSPYRRPTPNAPLLPNGSGPTSCTTNNNNNGLSNCQHSSKEIGVGTDNVTLKNSAGVGVGLNLPIGAGSSSSSHHSPAPVPPYVVKDAYRPYHRLDPMACMPLNNAGAGQEYGGPSSASGSQASNGEATGDDMGMARAGELFDDAMTPQPYELNFEHSEFSDCYDSGVGAGRIQHYPSLYSCH